MRYALFAYGESGLNPLSLYTFFFAVFAATLSLGRSYNRPSRISEGDCDGQLV